MALNCDELKGGRRLRHGNHFGKIMYTINNLSAASLNERRALLVSFGHKLDSQPGFRHSRGYSYNSPGSPFGYSLRGFGPEPPKAVAVTAQQISKQ